MDLKFDKELFKIDNDFFKHLLLTLPLDKQGVGQASDQETDSEIEDVHPGGRKNKKQNGFATLQGQGEGKLGSHVDGEDSETEDPKLTKIKEKKKHKKNTKKKVTKKAEKKPRNSADNCELLRAKIQARIQELRGNRLSAEESQEKKRLKRKDSKLKLKMRRRAEKQNRPTGATVAKSDGSGSDKGVTKASTSGSAKPVLNKEGKMVYSKFDFSDTGTEKANKSQSDLTGKDYKRLLEKIEKRKERIEKMRETNVYGAKKLHERTRWETAILKAEGEKVKDNPEILKKALKKKEQVKTQHSKKWQERVSQTEKVMEAKQAKRTRNLDKRKQAKVDKKIQRAKKKGRIVPGF